MAGYDQYLEASASTGARSWSSPRKRRVSRRRNDSDCAARAARVLGLELLVGELGAHLTERLHPRARVDGVVVHHAADIEEDHLDGLWHEAMLPAG